MSQPPIMLPPPVSPPAVHSGASALEIVAGVVLGIAAVLAAFSAYQGALADGESLEGYTASTQHLSDANFFFNASSQQFATDQQLFVSYATALNTPGQEEVAGYLKDTLMSENLRSAVDWWLTTDAITPFDDDPGNPYTDESGDLAAIEQEAAGTTFTAGSTANKVGDQFELAGVILAIALFFGGISTLMKSSALGWALISIGSVSLVVGVGLVLGALST